MMYQTLSEMKLEEWRLSLWLTGCGSLLPLQRTSR